MIRMGYQRPLKKENFTDVPDKVPSGQRRFTPSPMASSLIATRLDPFEIVSPAKGLKISSYIIPTGVNHHPNDWTGGNAEFNNFKNLFECLGNKFRKDISRGHAMLLIDQSLEGYQTTWLWQWFHDSCTLYGINPRSIIYVTGNLLAEEQYKKFAETHSVKDRINVIGYPHFEEDMYTLYENTYRENKKTFEDYYNFKNSNEIKLYSLLQKRPRPHRPWFFGLLVKNNLHEQGLINMDLIKNRHIVVDGESMPPELIDQANKELPRWIDDEPNNIHPDNFYIRRLTENYFERSWVHVVSEASYSHSEHSLFISEKTFKPILCYQPFMILGSKHSLKKLREMGYRTFQPFIDEDYDNLDGIERMKAIIESIKKINSIENKIEWYAGMREILEHNFQTIANHNLKSSTYLSRLKDIYGSYFNA